MTDITVTCHLPSGSNVTWSNVTWWNNGTSIEESTFDESAFLQFSQGFLDDTLGFFFIKSQFCIALAVLLIIQYHIRHYLAGVKCVNWINEVNGRTVNKCQENWHEPTYLTILLGATKTSSA